jgi:MFS family permease
MVSLKAGPMYVALTQTASALPFFIFALPAGAIGDIVDRRKLILFTESWMVAVATGTRGGNSRWVRLTAAAADSDLCIIGWRCFRVAQLARRLARSCQERGPSHCVRT